MSERARTHLVTPSDLQRALPVTPSAITPPPMTPDQAAARDRDNRLLVLERILDLHLKQHTELEQRQQTLINDYVQYKFDHTWTGRWVRFRAWVLRLWKGAIRA